MRTRIVLMALDLPEFERPAKRTSVPTSAGNCSSLAADNRKRILGNWLMGGYVGVEAR